MMGAVSSRLSAQVILVNGSVLVIPLASAHPFPPFNAPIPGSWPSLAGPNSHPRAGWHLSVKLGGQILVCMEWAMAQSQREGNGGWSINQREIEWA